MGDREKKAEPVAWMARCPHGCETLIGLGRVQTRGCPECWKSGNFTPNKQPPDVEWQPLYLKSPQPERDREVLESIRIYGSDTLSGRVDGPEDAEWYRGAVVEMTRRAFLGGPVARREPEGMTYATRWDLLLADHHGELTVRRFDPKRNAIPVWIGTAPQPEREREAIEERLAVCLCELGHVSDPRATGKVVPIHELASGSNRLFKGKTRRMTREEVRAVLAADPSLKGGPEE